MKDVRGTLSCFKAYDIRGLVPDELDVELARLIGGAFAAILGGGTVAVGRDMRLTGGEIAGALMQGLTDSGVHGGGRLRHFSPGIGRRSDGDRQSQPGCVQWHEVGEEGRGTGE